jgi:hypothetical protein
MELPSSWGLCVLDDAAGAATDAADRARQILARLARTQERHYSVPILQWTATFFSEQGLTADTSACAAALMQIAEATAQPEAIAALAHARGETLLADQLGDTPRRRLHARRVTAGLTSRELDVMELVSQGNRGCSAGPGPRRYAGLPSSERCPGRTWSGKSRANRATRLFASARDGQVPVLC